MNLKEVLYETSQKLWPSQTIKGLSRHSPPLWIFQYTINGESIAYMSTYGVVLILCILESWLVETFLVSFASY